MKSCFCYKISRKTLDKKTTKVSSAGRTSFREYSVYLDGRKLSYKFEGSFQRVREDVVEVVAEEADPTWIVCDCTKCKHRLVCLTNVGADVVYASTA